MFLEKINTPQDIKSFSVKDLKILSQEIRAKIIEVISRKGGHLASSLGAVEICMALHYCLDTPKDYIVFDVGHQSYAHKLLTGRSDKFEKIREFNGISGFPYHRESEYDPFTVGHASNAVSLALGVAEANKLMDDPSKAVAVIGDGSLSGGEAFEALNNAGHLQSDILVIFNHNEMSISPSVGALSNYLNKFISLPIYNRFKEGVNTVLKKVPTLYKKVSPRIKKIEEVMKGLVVPGIFFEELGFRYFGPLDGHDLEVLIPTLNNVISLKGPRILHVVTKKGKGYPPAEEDPEIFHSAPTTKKNGNIQESYTDVFEKKIVDLAKRDKKIVCLTAAMCTGTGLTLFRDKFPERFFDVGIAEQHLVSFSGGLSKRGLKPVVCVYSTFLQRALDQVIEDVLLQDLKVTFVLDRAGLVGEDGPTHHGIFDIAYLRNLPGMVILAPKDKKEFEKALEFSLALGDSCFLRIPKHKAPIINDDPENIFLGKAEILKEGEGVALMGLGSMVEKIVKVDLRLRDKGFNPLVINARFVKPLDEEMLISLIGKIKVLFTIEEGVVEGGFGSAVLEFYEKRGLLDKIKVVRIGIPSEFVTFGSREELLDLVGLSEEKIFWKVVEEFKKEKG